MRIILTTETDVALFIGQQFQKQASAARGVPQDSKRTQSIRNGLTAFRDALIGERQNLIKQEIALYSMV